LLKDVPVDSGKDETAIVHVLNMSAEQGHDILFRISGYLLEFIYGNDARLVGF